MQPKEVTMILGINRDRIKYFIKEDVFHPENETVKNRGREYTERDVEQLRQLIVLTKSGLTCGDIKKVQDGSWSLSEAIVHRQREIQEEMARMLGSLELSNLMLQNKEQYSSFSTDFYWHEIEQREHAGEEFIDPMEDTHPISLIRTVTCPACGSEMAVDLEEYVCDETVNDSRFDDDMGPDMVFSFDSDATLQCEDCGKTVRVRGWIREYPIGAYDSEDIQVELEEDSNE